MPSNSLPIVLSPEADEDLIEIWGYLAHEASDRVADGQLSEIETMCSTLETWPAFRTKAR